jgi:hypothetical protein
VKEISCRCIGRYFTMYFSWCVLGAALLCISHRVTVKNTLFEDGDGGNIFLHLKKNYY